MLGFKKRCTSTMATLVSASAVILTGPAQPPINLSWYPISTLPACQGTYQNWGALLFSYLHASVAQDYAFEIYVTSAARLWVNNTLIINATCNQTAYGSNPTSTANSATAWTGSITLPIGYYNITLEYHTGASGDFDILRRS
ncbi:hypothetical protein WJX79_011000 [Trebouxia sp. C0005]